jgi:sec-independent protein translocase protein TatA
MTMFTLALLSGGMDWVIIAGVALLLFGTSKVAGLGKALGESIRDFKKAVRDDDEATPQSEPLPDEKNALHLFVHEDGAQPQPQGAKVMPKAEPSSSDTGVAPARDGEK